MNKEKFDFSEIRSEYDRLRNRKTLMQRLRSFVAGVYAVIAWRLWGRRRAFERQQDLATVKTSNFSSTRAEKVGALDVDVEVDPKAVKVKRQLIQDLIDGKYTNN